MEKKFFQDGGTFTVHNLVKEGCGTRLGKSEWVAGCSGQAVLSKPKFFDEKTRKIMRKLKYFCSEKGLETLEKAVDARRVVDQRRRTALE